jgi:tetratricopeptide (TPR) repeat protein
MTRSAIIALIGLAATSSIVVAAILTSPSPAVAGPVMSELAYRDIQIGVWEKALAMDSASAIALGQLAGLYMQRARESGNESNYAEAEMYSRRSLALRENRNGHAFAALASSLLAQHKFLAADSVVRRLVRLEPDTPEYLAMHGEIQMELGNYAAAMQDFQSLWPLQSNLSIAPRLARWLEVTGRPDDARKLLERSLALAKMRRDIPREQLAWFHLRLGDIELRYGRVRSARQTFDAGLDVVPDDHRLLAAMARLQSLEGNPAKAIEYGERAMAVKLDPATLGTIADAYALLGDTAESEDYFRTMEVAVAGQPGAYHRAWSLFLLDHNRRIAEVLANAEQEIATRKDIYGFDLLAWALYRSGRKDEARAAMSKALSTGARDPLLLRHAALIYK